MHHDHTYSQKNKIINLTHNFAYIGLEPKSSHTIKYLWLLLVSIEACMKDGGSMNSVGCGSMKERSLRCLVWCS